MTKNKQINIDIKKLSIAILFFAICIIPINYYINNKNNSPKNYIYLSNSFSNWGLNVQFESEGKKYNTISNYNGFIDIQNAKKIKKIKVFSRGKKLLFEQKESNVPFNIAIKNKVNVLSFILSFIGSMFSVVIIFITLSIYKADKNRKLSRPFLTLSLTPLMFYFTTMLQNILATGGKEVLAGTIFAFHRLGFMFYAAAFYELCYGFSCKPNIRNKYLTFFYAIPILLTPILLSWIIAGSDIAFISMWNFSFNTFLQIFNFYTIFTLTISVYLLIKAVSDKNNPLYQKAKLMILGVLTAITILITLFIVPQLFLTNEPFRGYYDVIVLIVTFLFYTSLIYAVIKSHIINIYSILNQTLINIFVSIITVVIYIFIQEMYLIYVQPENIVMHSALILFLLTIIIEPLRTKIKNFSENLFFPEKTILKPALNFYNEKISTNFNKENIVEKVKILFTKILSIKKVNVILVEDNILNHKKIKKVKINASIFNKSFFHLNDFSDSNKTIKMLFNSTKSTLIIPLICNTNLVGLLCLSEKKSNKTLTIQEISIYVTLAANIALSIFNAEKNEEILKNQKLLAHTEKLSAVGKISASIAHEIKNPLAAIKPLIALLPEMKNDPQFISDFMDIVPRQLEKINTKVITLLSFSKKDNMLSEELIIEPIIDDVIKLLNINLRKNEIKIIRNYDKHANKNKVLFSKDQLYSVLSNLLINSIDAAQEKKGIIEISTSCLKNEKKITIYDNGCGISKENISKIFDPFFSTKKTGTGLGLSTVSQIINTNNGQINVESDTDKGTSFTIILPVI